MYEEDDVVCEENKREEDTIFLCKCLLSEDSIQTIIPPRKLKILNAVDNAENYLRERRIPELIRFFMTKILSDAPDNPTLYLEELLDHCMLFRAGHGTAPILYEDCHLEAVIKSFDPGNRGWLSTGQIRRLYQTLGLKAYEYQHDKISTDVIFKDVKRIQESELLSLVSAGFPINPDYDDKSENSDLISVIKPPPKH